MQKNFPRYAEYPGPGTQRHPSGTKTTPKHVGKVAREYYKYQRNLINIPFTTLNDYLHWLRAIAELLGPHGHQVVFLSGSRRV